MIENSVFTFLFLASYMSARILLAQPPEDRFISDARKEILKKQDLYRKGPLDDARRYSNTQGEEAYLVDSYPYADRNTHVISLGSGPDIFRPIFVFPRAKHIHLIDYGKGWGSSFSEMLNELTARIAFLDRRAKLETIEISPGYFHWRIVWAVANYPDVHQNVY